jgi:hypothetical protein
MARAVRSPPGRPRGRALPRSPTTVDRVELRQAASGSRSCPQRRSARSGPAHGRRPPLPLAPPSLQSAASSRNQRVEAWPLHIRPAQGHRTAARARCEQCGGTGTRAAEVARRERFNGRRWGNNVASDLLLARVGCVRVFGGMVFFRPPSERPPVSYRRRAPFDGRVCHRAGSTSA